MSEKNYRYVGKEMSNELAYAKATGKAKYGADQDSGKMLYIRLLTSTVARGRILKIETDDAWKVAGVKGIYTCFNTDQSYYDRGRVLTFEKVCYQEQLFSPEIRFYGEKIAAVCADSEEHARKAVKLLKVTYENEQPMLTVEAASAENAEFINKEPNVFRLPCEEKWETEEHNNTEETGIITKTHCEVGRMTHLSMETHVCTAEYDPGRKFMTIYTACQTVFGIRSTIADFLHMPYSRVRVVKTLMGGSFGCKQETILEPIAAYIAKDLGAKVRLVFTREEEITNTMMKHSFTADLSSVVTPEGKISSISVDCTLDSGAYQTISPSYARGMGGKLAKVYRIPHMKYQAQTVCTNTPVNGSFRSWGSSETAFMMESHLDTVCRKMNIDPVEFRLRNIMESGENNLMKGVSIGDVHFREVLTKGRDFFQWEKRKAACKARNSENGRYRYGVGMALGSHTSSFYPDPFDAGICAARIQEDGSVILNVCVHDHGCGTVLALRKIAAECLEVDIDQIELGEGDTDKNFYDYGCYASRSVYMQGQAVILCCERLIDLLKQLASEKTGIPKASFCYENGCCYVEKTKNEKITITELVRYSLSVKQEDIFAQATAKAKANPGVAAAHFTELRVDTFTGAVKILHCLSVHDIGRAINPDLCRGQVGSGIQQGMGMALCEEIKLDPRTGENLITNLKNYDAANICEMPDYDVIFIEEPEEHGPYGAKSIGEVTIVPVAPAILAAVRFALDVEIEHVPMTPAVILAAWEKKMSEKVQ